MPKCSHCKTDKPLTSFAKDSCAKRGHRSNCNECRKSERSKERDRVYQARWRTKNPMTTEERARKLENGKRWKAAHRAEESARLAVASRTRRLRYPKWLSAKQKQQMVEFYRNRPKGHHVDHIVPLQGKNVSGLHVPWNLQYLPELENKKKTNKF